MRKIKAHIKTSPDRNLTYKLYRDNLETNVPASADLLNLLTPVMTIKETDVPKKAFLISEEEAAVDITAIITADFIPYTIKHTMLKDMLHGIIIKITKVNNTSKTFTIKFNNAQEVISVKDELDADYDISTIFDVSMRQMIKIKDTYVADALKVRISYFTEVIEVVDYSDPQVGVTYNGPVPFGKVNATLAKSLKNVNENALIIPYFEVVPTATTAAETYNYRLLAFDAANNISDPSELMKVQLQQPVAELKYSLQTCIDTTAASPTWVNSGYLVRSGEVINYGKYGTPEFDALGSILVNRVVPQVAQSRVQANYNSDETSVTLSFDNPWVNNLYTERKTKAFRLKASFDSNENIKLYSDIIQHETVRVDIDSVTVLRCEVLDPSAPFDSAAADKVGSFCLNNGRLYNTIKSSGSNPVLDAQLNSGQTHYNGEAAIPVIPMNNGGGTDRLALVDDQVAPGKHYKYAIIIEDGMKNTSAPTYHSIITTAV